MHNPNFTLIALAWLGSSLLALPLLAVTARYGLVPLVESVAVARAAGQARPSAALLEQRLAGLERDMAALTVSVARITVASAAVEPGARSPRLVAGGSSTTAGVTGGHPAH